MGKLFGTDGVRGVANEKLSPELAFQIGQAAGRWLIAQPDIPNRVVQGRDTRRSGAMLGAALAAGFCSVGVDAVSLGIVPTGCISWVARHQEYGLGAVISASHNPAPDNGIKLMTSEGTKISAEGEDFIESHLGATLESRPTGGSVGLLTTPREEISLYEDWLLSLVPEKLDGLTVAIDAAHGAAFELGIRVFERLGAKVISTGTSPDGMNINEEGGATKPGTIQDLTQVHKADLGVAYDGDADRAVFSDSEGRLINGDRTMAIWCAHWAKHGGLDPAAVVGTVMSNGGFEAYMQSQGIWVHRTDVGDKYVSAKLREIGGRVGGEQSGHIIFPEHGPTGDGLVTALQIARILKREGRPAVDFYGDFENWPQVLVNLEVARKDGWNLNEAIQSAVKSAEESLGSRGRVNLRASGTQPILRVMVEADDMALRDEVTESLVGVVLGELGGTIYSRVDLTHALGD